jgi:hypothetical protein
MQQFPRHGSASLTRWQRPALEDRPSGVMPESSVYQFEAGSLFPAGFFGY